MVSIERSHGSKERIEANRPFGAITVEFGESSVVLPKLDWSSRQFIWLDYDDPLLQSMLFDVSTIGRNAQSGSVVAVSVQCQQAMEISQSEDDPEGPSAALRFRTTFGRSRVDDALSDEDLYGWPYAAIVRRMLLNEIEASLAIRNMGVAAAKIVSFKPICEIEYEDGAKMTTLIGILVAEEDQAAFEACNFDKLDFKSAGSLKIRISVPKITIREVRYLERQLPGNGATPIQHGPIPPSEAKKFADLYRYLPNFAVLES